MLLIVPRPKHELSEIETQLDTARLDEWIAALEPDVLDVAIPRFRVERSASMVEALNELGVRRLFTDSAELDGFGEGLFVSEVQHAVFVEVDEQGSEAAAATAVVTKARSAIKYNSFVADQPFLFLIRDRRSGALLFVGRVAQFL